MHLWNAFWLTTTTNELLTIITQTTSLEKGAGGQITTYTMPYIMPINTIGLCQQGAL